MTNTMTQREARNLRNYKFELEKNPIENESMINSLNMILANIPCTIDEKDIEEVKFGERFVA